MWKGVTGSLGPCSGGGIAGMVVGSQWRSWAARVYRAAVMMWWACPSRTMWRSVQKSFGRWAAGWTVMWARARWWKIRGGGRGTQPPMAHAHRTQHAHR